MSTLATDLLEVACYLVVAALLYDLLKPVSRGVSMLAASFSVIGCATQALGSVLQLAAMVVSAGARYLSALGIPQLQVPALWFLGIRAQVLNTALVLFGFYCLVIGYLIFRSTILPRIVGVLMAFGGLAYVTNSRSLPGLGVGLAILWLIVIAVSSQRWKTQSGPATEWRSTLIAGPLLNRE
jgi:hypothetical protein